MAADAEDRSKALTQSCDQHLKIFTEIVVKLIGYQINCITKKLTQRSEYKSLEFKYSMAQKNIDRLEKELEVMKATQAGLK